MDVYVLNKDLELVMVVDTFTSLIWDKFYNKVGAGELYIRATAEALTNIQIGYYVQRSDDDMVCRVVKIELDTSAENGNFLIFTLESVEAALAQRIIWETATCTGKLEPWLHGIVSDSLGATAAADRQIKTPNNTLLITTGNTHGFKNTGSDQATYANVAEKITEICKREGWGWRLLLDGNHFKFDIYEGTDRTSTVFFSEDFGNLITTSYVDDCSNVGNIALIAGEGEGSARTKIEAGAATGADRYELYIDARDLSHSITYGELRKAYPGGTIRTETDYSDPDNPVDYYYYYMSSVDIPILDANQLAVLQAAYPGGTVVTVDDATYYRLTNIDVAELPTDTPADEDTAVVIDALYFGYLTDRGLSKMAEYGEKITFSGEIEPNRNFIYGTDYFLGDIVTIESGYGISLPVRIVEVEEVFDATGHTVTPKYEYLNTEE